MKGIKGKTVIITGGSRGIGKACCLEFARNGANVFFTYHKNRTEALKVEKETEKLKQKCLGIQADVKDYDQCRKVVEAALAKFGRLDIVINNAGITKDKALMMMSVEEWKEVIDTNLGGVFNMSRAAITTFLKQKSGCIINMSSISGLVGTARQTNYSASKAGIIGFSKALAKEVAAYNIRVNVVCPGYISTDMVNELNDVIKENFKKAIPVKEFGMPEDIANTCVFLASDAAKYIVGEVIKIDGGVAI